MALARVLSALELGIASETETLTLCGNILDTIGRLPKWKGHLYNWYNTKTLAPLDPAYVSTVDSGNLAAALTACAAGFAAHGAPALAKRAGGIAAAMDFRALYDEKRRLFPHRPSARRERPGAELVRSFRERRAPDGVFHHRLRADRAPPLAAAQPRAGGLSEAARHGKLVGQPF